MVSLLSGHVKVQLQLYETGVCEVEKHSSWIGQRIVTVCQTILSLHNNLLSHFF